MEKNRAILFCRVSSISQSNQRQLLDLEKEAEKRGLHVVGVITEKISGATKVASRSAIQELLQKARNKEMNKVLISELSRLGRTREVLSIIEELSTHKVSLIIQDMGIETLTEDGKPSLVADILTSIINVMNKSERSTLIERVVSGIRAAQKNGIHCGRPKNSHESVEKFLRKHSRVVRDLKAGLSIRKVSKLHSISPVTAIKISKTLRGLTLNKAA